MELFKDIKKAMEFFAREKIIIFPTETVYGLGAVAGDIDGVEKIFNIKNRPLENPLIIHFHSITQVEEYCHINPLERTLLEVFTPGPLTLLLKKKDDHSFPLATNNSSHICARIPRGFFAQQLIKTFGPISAPSANLSGQLTITKESMIISAYEKFSIGAYIDDSVVRGIESTIVAVVNTPTPLIKILRKGLIDKKTLEAYGHVEYDNHHPNTNDNIIPGTRFLHYQTRKSLMIKDHKTSHSFHIDRGNNICDFNLSPTNNMEEIYNNYFYSLYLGDQSNFSHISINTLPNTVEFHSLRDRLEKSLLKR